MKKNIFFIGVSICLLVLLGVGLSYSMWNMSISQDTNNVIATTSECFDVTLTNESNAIKLENAYPITDTKGKTLTPFTFTIKNVCNTAASYSVSLESLKDSTLSSKFLKTMVNDNEPIILGSLDTTDTVNSGSIESRILAKGTLMKNSSKDYSLRLWIDYDTTMEDLDNETKVLKSKIIIKATSLGYTGETVFNFDYTGDEQTFTVPVTGTYKLEIWGAQGGSYSTYIGGFGGYSTGNINLKSNDELYINVGGQGSANVGLKTVSPGGYNGGGSGYSSDNHADSFGGGGGGATHIATKSGLLNTLENYKNNILIVAGGGAGFFADISTYPTFSTILIGHAGGYSGVTGTSKYDTTDFEAEGGTQISGYAFGEGVGCPSSPCSESPGGGGGYYGGKKKAYTAGGGSGYIGNSLLKEKSMYCYNCQESLEESIKTISITCSEEMPTENCAKKGNGYARITLISIDE